MCTYDGCAADARPPRYESDDGGDGLESRRTCRDRIRCLIAPSQNAATTVHNLTWEFSHEYS